MSRSSARSAVKVSAFETSLYAQVDAYTLADHPELIKPLFDLYQLDEYLTVFDHMLKGHRTDVYHGKMHGYMTALNCYEGALYSQCTTSEIKVLLVAGLFHDLRHSCGVQPDSVNIKNAVHALTVLHAAMSPRKRLSDAELRQAQWAIRRTKYPHAAKPLTLVCDKVLRDADMMSAYCADPAVRLNLFTGLHEEQSLYLQQTNDFELLTLDAFCTQQQRFATAMVWSTYWGKTKAFHLNWQGANRELVAQLQTSACLAKMQDEPAQFAFV